MQEYQEDGLRYLNKIFNKLFVMVYDKYTITFIHMKYLFAFTLFQFLLTFQLSYAQIKLPIASGNRTEIEEIDLTSIGDFGIIRKERPGVPEHLHTGIDIKRPSKNYNNEPIFSVSRGIVISIRDDGPFAQIIIEHKNNNDIFWTVYEHIAGIKVKINQEVNENMPIARFMNKYELDKFGWQFDHFHFEILKYPPKRVKTNNKQPQYKFCTYNLICYNKNDLDNYYIDPFIFFKENLKNE